MAEEQESVDREIKVITDQEVAKSSKPNPGGYIIRKWKVSLFAIDDIGDKYPLNFVEKVEYHLHPTFEHPLRVVRKPPFTLSEKGWGEFDMKIVLHFTDKSVPPQYIMHDLNFQKNHYEVPHTLTFTDPKLPFKKQLTPEMKNHITKPKIGRTKRLKPYILAPYILASKKRRKSSDDTDRKEDGSENFGYSRSDVYSSMSDELELTPGQSPVLSPAHSSISSSKSMPESSQISTPKSSSPESFRSISTNNDKENDYKVDYQRLADNLYALQGEDIIKVIDIVNAHRTSNMYINDEVDGEFHLDLYTLGDDLVKKLWEFTETTLSNYSQ